MKKKESILGMAFFGPALILLTLFLFLPMVLTLVFSFTDYFALNPDMTHFVGLENYINIFKDELFVKSFFNTVKFVHYHRSLPVYRSTCSGTCNQQSHTL